MICTGFMIIFEVATALSPFYGVRGPDVYSADNYIHVVPQTLLLRRASVAW